MGRRRRIGGLVLVLFFAFSSGCEWFHQPGVESSRVYSKIFLIDYNTAWQATLDAIRHLEKTKQSRPAGILQTSWTENTAERNFTDSFGAQETFLKARYRLTVAVAPGTLKGRESVKISIEKEQQTLRDALEGWRSIKSDGIDENTILYRIGRLILIRLRLQRLEEEKLQQVLDEGV